MSGAGSATPAMDTNAAAKMTQAGSGVSSSDPASFQGDLTAPAKLERARTELLDLWSKDRFTSTK
jgi:hypothetical protein